MTDRPRVFISYSHDSEAHRERVLGLSERLRQDGIQTILDRYVNGTPPEGWPRWMLNRLDEAGRVLLICTPTYYRRFRGHEEPGKGKGVDWEGAIVTQEVYDARSETTRFIPVLFDPADETCIPEPLRSHTRHCLGSEHDYQGLYDAILEQSGVAPGELGPIKRKERRRAAPLTFADTKPPPAAAPGPKVDLNHLPADAEHFLGRGPELAALDTAWTEGSATSVVELIAPGGTGKTALVKRWLDCRLRPAGWGGANRVFGWSFYSQGTGEDRQASEDPFLAAAIRWFGVEIEPSVNPADKGRALADCLYHSHTLLILDGLEPLQYPPGPLAGELRAPGLKALLTQLAAAGHPGLCVLTSREWLQDLAGAVRGDTHPQGPVLRLDLGNLSDPDGACLLHRHGATRAGAAPIPADDPELIAASQEVRGHALTLSLLGRYLRLAHGGDIRQWGQVDFGKANEATGGHAFRVVAAYEHWLAAGGEHGARCLSALRLLGLFDRPASAGALSALRTAPPIRGLTEPLFERPKGWLGRFKRQTHPIAETDWCITLSRLAEAGLIEPPGDSGALDAHPLVREHLAESLRTRHPEAWREGHRRLYVWLKESVPHRPDGLDGLQPLYQAVAHGCLAGLWQETCAEVYIDRILRGTGNDGFYSARTLGAFGADLGAVAGFFAEPWRRPAPDLSAPDQAWLLNEAATRLRALGRLAEALEPMRAGAETRVRQEDWENAAASYGNLSELQLTLGRVPEAVADARRAVEHADRSGDAFLRMVMRTTLADALHQQGETQEALDAFTEAECLQAERQPQYPLLYSLQGFRYCDLLLAGAERAAWRGAGGARVGADPDRVGACDAVARRAEQALKIAEDSNLSLLTMALDHLTLARCALYADRLQGHPPGPEAREHAERALDRLRAAASQDHIPRGLLTRAWLRHALADPNAARADLDEAQRIAACGGMALHLADCALTRARLFHDRAALAEARRLIETHGYGRRLPELADAEAAAATWPPADPTP
ncbi:SEFIR domain-containing protein [Thioflavicoccus mobilis 8321]|uniref:SEFIR domain-containing protein n=1 Tax=Thioflavicoccus mobilis 8321 TaxID=765912 RepID=L0GVX2_9GAMM|nr:SEFIR domain-containing protein [Thioflavicoccus mobilis]AGA90131.1 SEFIR domain-containing protein [Thioflavicoccus mobilis 8321]